jgi:signal transduction histidine kinase
VAAAVIVTLVIRNPFEWRYQMYWHTIGWGSGALLYIVRGRTAKDAAGTAPGRRMLDATLNLLVPVGVAGAILLREQFIIYALPLITIVTVFLLFTGIVYHRYYNIEVRALRSGEIGLGAAEHERLALLGELSASIAHEVRNPLTGMRSLAQRLRDEPLDEDRRKRYLSVILDEIGRLERIVSNLLDVARRTTPATHVGVVDLAMLFSDLVLLVDARARQASVQIVARAGVLQAAAAREPLAQALLNLLLNAIAHAPAESRVELLAEQAEGSIAVIVRDEGPGIPAADRDRIFEPFHTGGGGTGLGLAVVRTLAKTHAWQVQVRDSPRGGAELRLLIPAAGKT